MKLYQYEKCETCRKAKKWLDQKGLEYQSVSIRDTPPSKTELEAMLDAHEGQYKKLLIPPARITAIRRSRTVCPG